MNGGGIIETERENMLIVAAIPASCLLFKSAHVKKFCNFETIIISIVTMKQCVTYLSVTNLSALRRDNSVSDEKI